MVPVASCLQAIDRRTRRNDTAVLTILDARVAQDRPAAYRTRADRAPFVHLCRVRYLQRISRERAMSRAAQMLAVGILSVGLGSSAHAQGVVTQKDLSLSMARTIAEGALDECKKQGFNTAVVVLDRSGQVLVQM